MEDKEKNMLEDMFFKLLHEEGHIFERLTLYEEFTYMTIDLMEKGKKEEAEPFIDLMEHFENVALEHNKELLCGFFFSLAEMLTLKFKYAKMANERIDRKDHIRNFILLGRKYGWDYHNHVMKNQGVESSFSLSHVKNRRE